VSSWPPGLGWGCSCFHKPPGRGVFYGSVSTIFTPASSASASSQGGFRLGTVEQAGSIRKVDKQIDIAGRGGGTTRAAAPVPWPPVLFSPLLDFPAPRSAISTCITTATPPARPGGWRPPFVTLRMPPASFPPFRAASGRRSHWRAQRWLPMRSTATGCSCSRGVNPALPCSAGVGCLARAIGGFVAGRCRWRRSSSASCPVIRFDPGKRLRILQSSSLDRRRDYGELIGFVCISIRKADEREQRCFLPSFR